MITDGVAKGKTGSVVSIRKKRGRYGHDSVQVRLDTLIEMVHKSTAKPPFDWWTDTSRVMVLNPSGDPNASFRIKKSRRRP